MQIKVESVGDVLVQNKLQRLQVNYMRDGKSQTRNLVGIGETKNVIDVLKSAKSGDLFEIDLKKDGEYWNWVGARASTGNTSSSSGSYKKGSSQGESRFETAEERFARQHYIVRQSSISSALEYYKLVEQKPPIEEVLGLAALMEKFVFGEMSDEQISGMFNSDVEEDSEDVT